MKKILLLFALLTPMLMFAEENKGPIFSCGFESKEEIKNLSGNFSGKAKFLEGKKGKALELLSGMSCNFPSKNCIQKTEGTLSAWICPAWKLRDIKTPRTRIFAVMNKEQKTKPIHRYNYFCILGNSYGNIEKGIPYQLYCLIRETKQEQGRLTISEAAWEANTWQHVAVSWRIGTGRKDGEFLFYLNGKLMGRRTDFRACKIDMGKYLTCAPSGLIDELKIWDRILTEEEIKKEAKK